MSGAARRLGGSLGWLLLLAACSSPSAPSRTTTPPPPATTSGRGTLTFVSATPAAGSDVIVDSSRTDQALLAATFLVAFDRAVANATIEMQVLDGSNRACGSAASDPQALVAGQAATFVVGLTTLSCALPLTVESLKATLVDADGTAGNEYLIGTFAAHHVARPPTAASLTLSGTVVERARGPLAGVRIAVEDGTNLGRYTVTDEAGRYVLADLVAGTFTVRASEDGYDDSHVRLTTGAGSVTQDFSMTRSAPPPAAITFVGSTPAPGGETTLSQLFDLVFLRDIRIQLSVRYNASLPDGKLELELLSDAGQQCAFSFVDQPIAANQPVNVTVDTQWVWQMSACGLFPVDTAHVKVTLLTQRGPTQNGRLQRTDYATQTFPVRYTIRRYPRPPDSPPADPMIESFRWRVELPVGGDPPIPGDPVSTTCVGREADGAPLTITIRVTWDGLPTQTFTQAFPEGAASSPAGAYHRIALLAPSNVFPSHATLECIVTNVRGDHVQQFAEIGYPR